MKSSGYWKAQSHQWGPGQVHIIHEDGDRTLCGKRLSECPGERIPSTAEYTCRACAKVLETRADRERREREWAERSRQYELQRIAEEKRWWGWYNSYLQSPEWGKKRKAVLARAKGRCEACGLRKATQVHHTTYAHVGNEPLFELRAVCEECHRRITSQDRLGYQKCT